jgi:hypothetical protein
MNQALGRQPDGSASIDGNLLNAPLFHSLIQRMEDGERHVVLDLGPPQAGTVALLSQYRCRLDIADLAANLNEIDQELEGRDLRSNIDRLLPVKRSERVDLVLCWDLLNYLSRPAIRELMTCIAERSKKGTLIHALVVYAERQMPVIPDRYVPVDDHSLRPVTLSQEMRPAPRYSPEDLSQCMPAYQLDRAMLLRNGMQEFLFRL